MPAMAVEFRRTLRASAELPEAGELVRDASKPGTVAYQQLTPQRLMALYEMAYMRMFVAWESYLEATFLRTMCGYVSPTYTPTFQAGQNRQPTLRHAYGALLLPGQYYLLWHSPPRVRKWAAAWFVGSPHELVIASNLARLEWFGAIRHRIAHGSEDAREKMDKATLGLAGRRFAASSPGRFLRTWNGASQPQERWLYTIAAELAALSAQISP
jgi:hypothetical protein